MSKQPIRAVACAAALVISLIQVAAVGAQDVGQVVQVPLPQLVPVPQLAPAPAVPAPAFTPAEPTSPQLFNVTTPAENVPVLDVIEAPTLAIDGTDAILMPSTVEDAPSILAGELPSAPVAASPPGTFVYVGQNEFGRWVDKAAPRPYEGLAATELDAFQREVITLWEKNQINSVWVYDIEPLPENNWAGWGPPPPGYQTRSLIPRTPEGAFLGGDLPWPPAGQPPAR